MTIQNFMWECECGHTEYDKISPQECIKCWKINSFIQVPEEIVREREKSMSKEDMIDELEEMEK
ncbi:MAG: hypothetical protein IIA87_02480 [Nanoarchaeota archaeon]|nr:hypothetical protein [Nanoarchaeota archaeon]